MSMVDFVISGEEPIRCPKCGAVLPTLQTKAALREGHTFTFNELAAFMALYADGAAPIICGQCSECGGVSYFKLPEAELIPIENPYQEEA